MVVESFYMNGAAFAVLQTIEGNGTTYVVAVPALQNAGKADGGSFVGAYFKKVGDDYVQCTMSDWPFLSELTKRYNNG